MKTNPLLAAVVFAAMPLVSNVSAQTPATPPPTPAQSSETLATPAPDQIVYSPRLPSAQELTDAAVARGVGVERIEQSSSQVTVVYKLSDGRTSTVAYVLLPTASTSTTTAITTTPPPAVVYRPVRRVVYYDPFYYEPWYAYPPVGVSIGLGFSHYYGRHYHGGHRHHGGFHHRRHR